MIQITGSTSPGLAATSRMPWRAVAVGLWQGFIRDLIDPYRPELHYMRGPGPRWREKHSGASRSADGTLARSCLPARRSNLPGRGRGICDRDDTRAWQGLAGGCARWQRRARYVDLCGLGGQLA